MAQFVNMHVVDLSKGFAPKKPLGVIGQGDHLANRCGAIVMMGKAPLALGGNCAGTAILHDGSTVPLTGTISDNEAYVELDNACYQVEGPITVHVKWVNGTLETTLISFHGTVEITETGYYIQPSTPIDDLPQLLAEIENMREATAAANAAAANASANIAPSELGATASAAHAQGSYFVYSGALYQATAAIAAGDTITPGTNCQAVPGGLGGDVAGNSISINDLDEVIDTFLVSDNILYRQPTFTVGVAGGTYQRANFYTLPASQVSAGDFYTFLCDQIENNTANAIRFKIMAGSTEIRNGAASMSDTSVPVQILQTDIDANMDSVVFFVTASLAAPLEAPCVLTNPRVIKGLTEHSGYSDAFKAAVDQEIVTETANISKLSLGTLVDGYVNSSTGQLMPGDTYKRTDYLPIVGPAVKAAVTASAPNVGMAFYDVNKTFVSGSGVDFSQHTLGEEIDVSVPASAFYVVYCAINAQAANMKITVPNYADPLSLIQENVENSIEAQIDTRISGLSVLTLGTLINGFVNTSGVIRDEGITTYKRTDYLPVVGPSVKASVTASASDVGMAFYDASKTFVPGSGVDFSQYEMGSIIDVTVPAAARYVVYCAINAQAANMGIWIPNYADPLTMIPEKVEDGVASEIEKTLTLSLGTLADGFVNALYGTLVTASSYKRTGYLPIHASKIKVTVTASASGVGMAFYDNALQFISGVDFSQYTLGEVIEVNVPAYSAFIVYCAVNAQAGNMKIVIPDCADAICMAVVNPCLWKESSECKTFRKILCIGDSLTEGRFDYKENGTVHEFTDSDYAYPAFLKSFTGRDATNAGDAGETSVSWYSIHGAEDFSGHDACIIQLGRNDYANNNNVSSADRIAAIENIIAKVKQDNPQIKIFISTQINYYEYTGVDTINADMAAIVANNTDCYLLDIYTYGRMTRKRDMYSHCTAVGYMTLAEYYFNYISYIMHVSGADFKTIQFTGTDRSYS